MTSLIPVIAFRVTNLYRIGMTPENTYHVTRGVWAASPENRNKKPIVALGIYQDKIVGAYLIEKWHPAGTTDYKGYRSTVKNGEDEGVNIPGRIEFTKVNKVNPETEKFLNSLVGKTFVHSEQNPVKYDFLAIK